MEVLRDGTFVYNIESGALARGLRPSKRSPRNTKFLVRCIGAVGLDNVLQVIDDLELDRIDTVTTITDAFPYPQVFVFTNVTIVCSRQTIYEWEGATLNAVLGPVTAGQLWSAVDFYDFIYMSNGIVSVLRDPQSKLYATTSVQPLANAICNFNGQVVIGGIV
jgi:hypothetical protein